MMESVFYALFPITSGGVNSVRRQHAMQEIDEVARFGERGEAYHRQSVPAGTIDHGSKRSESHYERSACG